jgi:hypothetical protein
VNNSVWHLRARIKELKKASGDYITAMLVLTHAYRDVLTLFEKQNPPGGQGSAQGTEIGERNLPEENRSEQNAELEEHLKAQQAELKALGLKSLYWSLIMLGSAVIFVATCIAIVSDLNP